MDDSNFNRNTTLGMDRVFVEILKRLDVQNETKQVYTVFGVWIVVIATKCCLKKYIKYLCKKKCVKNKNTVV
ncbi:PrGVORF12 [Pieris rapae granulovirus Wuhan]|uniref:PrGVORF12 n=1 Tax=Pieris rapae granulovirus Wuhan TaxID=2848030 RepID=D2J4H9_9BBAC|nr:PrGVORF12 [Betabaculovirus arrapae]ACZ63498.1 PrGVORF12 [Betabaculovirus arrapae]AGS18776.1 hypothetical protein [Pieris rapae granulovirus]UOS85686.1 hypothetical protein [Pieris rapae granulovirus]